MAAQGWWEKSRVHQALKRIVAGPGIAVDPANPSAPVISAKISTDVSNALSFGTDNGLFATSGGGSGTVTSVGVSTGTSGVGVTGSPITTSGTIDLDLGTLANVDDAPSDGTTYGRNNNAWVAAGGGGVVTRPITGVFSNNGLPLSGTITGTAAWIPYDFTITGWHMGGDGNIGSGTIDVQTSTNQTSWASITAAATPVTVAARSATSTTLTGWTANITGGTWVRFVGSGWGGWDTSSLILTVTTP